MCLLEARPPSHTPPGRTGVREKADEATEKVPRASALVRPALSLSAEHKIIEHACVFQSTPRAAPPFRH